jgi:Spy/CpxP family protein refolding chaperone
MLKQFLLFVVAASLISIAAPFAAAQNQDQDKDSQNNAQQPPPSQDNDRPRHGPPDPARRTEELTRQLRLTSDQQPKVLEALQSQRSQMESLRQDASLSGPNRRAKMMEIHRSTNEQIRSILDPNQQKKWDEMQARREQRMQDHRQGPPDAGSGQQSPQQ